jgi:hypothetical protein
MKNQVDKSQQDATLKGKNHYRKFNLHLSNHLLLMEVIRNVNKLERVLPCGI